MKIKKNMQSHIDTLNRQLLYVFDGDMKVTAIANFYKMTAMSQTK